MEESEGISGKTGLFSSVEKGEPHRELLPEMRQGVQVGPKNSSLELEKGHSLIRQMVEVLLTAWESQTKQDSKIIDFHMPEELQVRLSFFHLACILTAEYACSTRKYLIWNFRKKVHPTIRCFPSAKTSWTSAFMEVSVIPSSATIFF
jgi:hypothetical protein